jgi:hypothetical protein
MVLEGRPRPGSCVRPLLQTLPTELIHLIFDQLPLQDVLTARKTCSTLADLGIDHFGDQVPLVYRRDKFRALGEIAEHPSISKRMRSLFYRFDRCGWTPYEVWDGLRPDPQPKNGITPLVKDAQVEDHGADDREYEAVMARINGVPKHLRQNGYRAFEALCRDTAEIYESGYDLACLRLLFEGCPKLREVTIASHVGRESDRRLNAEFTAFSDAMTVISEDWTRVYAGVHQVLTVAVAVQESGIVLDSLTLSYVSQELFAIRTPALRALLRPLRRLRMVIHTLPLHEDQDGQDEITYSRFIRNYNDDSDERIRGSQYVARMIHLRELLAEARDLRVLNLQLGLDDSTFRRFGGARLVNAIGDTVYPHLYELSISMCEITAGHLVDLILRHKATLRRLYLGHLHLTTAKDHINWRTIFTMLSAQLPNLRVVRLIGGFLRNGCSDIVLYSDPRTTHSYRDSLEDFVLHGGVWPAKFSPVMRPQGSEKLPDISNDYMELDDPARDYDLDEFDL